MKKILLSTIFAASASFAFAAGHETFPPNNVTQGAGGLAYLDLSNPDNLDEIATGLSTLTPAQLSSLGAAVSAATPAGATDPSAINWSALSGADTATVADQIAALTSAQLAGLVATLDASGLASDAELNAAIAAIPAAPVTSVNGMTGVVTITDNDTVYDDTAISAAVSAAQTAADAAQTDADQNAADIASNVATQATTDGAQDTAIAAAQSDANDALADAATNAAAITANDADITALQSDSHAAATVASADGSVTVTASGTDSQTFNLAVPPGAISQFTYNDDNTCTHVDGNNVTTNAIPCLYLDAAETTYTNIGAGDDATIFPLQNGVIPAGATQAIVSGSQSNVAVTINADGSHDLMVSGDACTAGGWSYDYTVTGTNGQTDTATISGLIDNSIVPILTLSTDNAAGQSNNISLVLANGGSYDVDWGDGNVDTGIASTTAFSAASNTYVSAYSGDVTILASACESVTQFRSSVGYWSGAAHLITANAPGITYLFITGQNTLSGDAHLITANAPGITHLIVTGQNTLSGDAHLITANAPGIATLNVTGQNTLSGDGYLITANAPGTKFLLIAGQNTLSGAAHLITANAPGITYLFVSGQNTLSGDAHLITANAPGITALYVTGQNTLSGDGYLITANAPGIATLYVTGQNTLSWGTAAWGGVTTNARLVLLHGQPKSQADVDNILVGLANVTSWASEKTVDVSGINAAPSATGSAACTTILANGAVACVTN